MDAGAERVKTDEVNVDRAGMENGSFGSVVWSIHRGARTNALARAHQKALHERTQKRTPAPRNNRLSERKREPAALFYT